MSEFAPWAPAGSWSAPAGSSSGALRFARPRLAVKPDRDCCPGGPIPSRPRWSDLAPKVPVSAAFARVGRVPMNSWAASASAATRG